MPSKNKDYRVLPDSQVLLIWRCATCGMTAEVPPTFFEESGTPICHSDRECDGNDMKYIETRLMSRPKGGQPTGSMRMQEADERLGANP